MALKYALAGVVGLALATGCNGGQPPAAQRAYAGNASGVDVRSEADAPTVEGVARNYAELQLMTAKPVHVDRELLTLCTPLAIEDASDRARERSGPHASTAIRIFMNDLAAEAFCDSGATYPVGAVIVKEKQGSFDGPGNLPHEPVETPLGVAGMIKRAAGYDAQHGDWEYFYFEDASKIEQGRISSCIQCHRNAAATGYIFGDWSDPG
jgi:hypothetical protein